MELPYSPLDDHVYPILPLDHSEVEKKGWTFEENKLFENAVAEVDPGSPGFLASIASRIPWRSKEEIQSHYNNLVEDIEMIDAGLIPIPGYQDTYELEHQAKPSNRREIGSTSKARKTGNDKQRRRGVPWTATEHHSFLMGLHKYGKGDWRSISRYFVRSKTPTQVASHAQKYFRRQTSTTPMEKRRPSIHDIQSRDPAILTSMHQQPTNNIMGDDEIPLSPSILLPTDDQNADGEIAEVSNDESPMFLPMDSTFRQFDRVVNKQASNACSSLCLFPNLGDDFWG